MEEHLDLEVLSLSKLKLKKQTIETPYVCPTSTHSLLYKMVH